MKKFIILSIISLTLLQGCSLNNITFTSKSESSHDLQSNSSSASLTPQKNSSPALNEKFFCYPLVSSGTIYTTVTGAECFSNISEAGIPIENFDDGILENNDIFDRNTGEILAPNTAFILVHITMENIGAVSSLNENSQPFFQGLNPELYGDKYCGEYDFSASGFGINTDKKANAADISNIGSTGVDYFSLKGQLYSDYYRSFLFNLKPDTAITFDIGKFVIKTIETDELAQMYGGQKGDDLISRYMLNMTNSPHDPCVKLELKG